MWRKEQLGEDASAVVRALASRRVGGPSFVYAERTMVFLLRCRFIVSLYLNQGSAFKEAFPSGEVPRGSLLTAQHLHGTVVSIARENDHTKIDSVHILVALIRSAPEDWERVSSRLLTWFKGDYPEGWPETRPLLEAYRTLPPGPDRDELISGLLAGPYLFRRLNEKLDAYLRSSWYPFDPSKWDQFRTLPAGQRGSPEDTVAFIAHQQYRKERRGGRSGA